MPDDFREALKRMQDDAVTRSADEHSQRSLVCPHCHATNRPDRLLIIRHDEGYYCRACKDTFTGES